MEANAEATGICGGGDDDVEGERGAPACHLNNVVLHDVATGRVLLPNVQFVYEDEEIPPQVLQRAWLTVKLDRNADAAGERNPHEDKDAGREKGESSLGHGDLARPTSVTRVAQINSGHPEARVQGFHISSDETAGETLHIEGFFPLEYVLLCSSPPTP